MLMMSFRVSKKKITVLCAALLTVAVLAYVGIQKYQSNHLDGSLDTASVAKITSGKIENNDQRIAFLGGFGWEVENEASEVVEVLIPETFDDVYTKYNAMQKNQGFDLEKYQGKKVKRYTYVVTNYPGVKDKVVANMLIYQNKVIGGDVCSVKLDGFMHGFQMKDSSDAIEKKA